MAETVNPIVTGIKKNEQISDPRLREFYFGSPDYEGIMSEGRRAAEGAYGRRFDPRGVAGYSPFDQQAMNSMYSGIGGYKPYLDFQKDALLEGMGTIGDRRGLIDNAKEGYLRAGEMEQPYLSQAEQQYGMGMGDYMSSLGRQGPSARDFQRASLQGFDPRSTAAYNNPFENQVVQQTIDDVFKQGEISDIGQRARDIQSGGQSAFGSRAKLGAEERRAALGRGLGEALSGIRSKGFDTAQSRAMDESRFGRSALERAGQTEAGYGRDMLGARRGFASDMMGIGSRRGDIARRGAGDMLGISGELGGIGRDYANYGRDMGDLGGRYQDMGRDERNELSRYGQDARGMKQRQIDAQYDADERNRFRGMKAVDYMRDFMPQYTPGGTRIDTTYGMPQDPSALGLGAFFNAYSNYGGQYGNQNQTQNQNTGNTQTTNSSGY